MNKWTIVSIIAVVLLVIGVFMGVFVGFSEDSMVELSLLTTAYIAGVCVYIKKTPGEKSAWWWATFGFITGGSILAAVAVLNDNIVVGIIAAVVFLAGVIKMILSK